MFVGLENSNTYWAQLSQSILPAAGVVTQPTLAGDIPQNYGFSNTNTINTRERWQVEVGGNGTAIYSWATAQTLTAFAYAAGVFNSSASLVLHSRSSEVAPWVEIAQVPLTKKAAMVVFDEVSATELRLTFANLSANNGAAILWAGQHIRMPIGPGRGFTPPSLAINYVANSLIAQGGQALGEVAFARPGETTADFRQVLRSWAENTWLPFAVEIAQGAPAILLWDNITASNDAALVVVNRSLPQPTASGVGRVDISVPLLVL